MFACMYNFMMCVFYGSIQKQIYCRCPFLVGYVGSTLSLDVGIGELHTGSMLSGVDPESYFDLHVVPGLPTKRILDCGYLVQYSQAYSVWVGLISLGRLVS